MAARLSIPDLKRTASLRPVGFVDAVLARGTIDGDQVLLEDNALAELIALFPDPRARRPKPSPSVAPPTPSSTFSLAQLKATAGHRPAGFVDAILARGKVDGDLVTLSAAALGELRARFANSQPLPLPPADGKYWLAAIMAAAVRRPPGYLDFILARGTIEGDLVTLDEATLREIRDRFPPLPQPRLKEPTVAEMAANFTQAIGDWVKAGFPVVRRETYEKRHGTCLGCDYWDARARGGLGKCNRCGCSRAKLWLASSKCPLNPPKWGRENG